MSAKDKKDRVVTGSVTTVLGHKRGVSASVLQQRANETEGRQRFITVNIKTAYVTFVSHGTC